MRSTAIQIASSRAQDRRNLVLCVLADLHARLRDRREDERATTPMKSSRQRLRRGFHQRASSWRGLLRLLRSDKQQSVARADLPFGVDRVPLGAAGELLE